MRTLNTYFIDATLGNDNNDGRSESSPWKSLKNLNIKNHFSPGDSILLKKGEVWYGQTLNIKSSGEENNPIVISSYGHGREKPIITSISPLRDALSENDWEYLENYTWRSKKEIDNPGRLFMQYEASNDDAVQELVKAYSINNLGLNTFSAKDKTTPLAPDIWFWSSSKKEEQGLFKRLHIYNGSDSINPSQQSGSDTIYKSTTSANTYRHINIVGQQHLILDGLEFHGGVQNIYIGNSKHIKARNCNIGKYCTNGVVIANSDFVVIDHNDFNTVYHTRIGLSKATLTHESYPKNLKGTDGRGNGNGVYMVDDGAQCVISNNTFKNWSHAAIFLLSKTPENKGIHSNKIYNNAISAEAISYARGFSTAGVSRGVYNNEIHNNTVINTTIQSQIAGELNYFHHNTIDHVTQSDLRAPGSANGIHIANNREHFVAENNYFDFNTISNCDDAGININNWGSSKSPRNPVRNNKFRNNIITNCGKQINGKNDHVGLAIADGSLSANPIVENNEYTGNQIVSFDSQGNKIAGVIVYHKEKYNATSFNTGTAALRHNDIAQENIDDSASAVL